MTKRYWLHDASAILVGGGRVSADSRRIAAGDGFVATATEPARSAHIAEAEARGAEVVIASHPRPRCSAPVVRTADARYLAALASLRAHGLEERCPPLLGVTGTDGKTSVSFFAWVALGGATGAGAARVGTLGYHDGRDQRPGTHTTPPVADLHPFLSGLPTACPGVALEISSHAIEQRRLAGLSLHGLVFTGIGSDHLDYHRYHARYLAAKLAALREMRPGARCVIAGDDPRASVLRHAAVAAGARPLLLGTRAGRDRVRLSGSPGAWDLELGGRSLAVHAPMPGAFNAWNAAAAALLVAELGVDPAVALERIAAGPAVPGRLQRVGDAPLAYVDYAHTPGAIERVLRILRAEHPERRLVAVVGCGGDRDRGKRSPMARAALAADAAVFTSDNPRSEDPAAIIADMLAGLEADMRARVVCEVDRREAIAAALAEAGRDGVVVVCGKGHETEQIIGARREPFDDVAVVRELLAAEDGQA